MKFQLYKLVIVLLLLLNCEVLSVFSIQQSLTVVDTTHDVGECQKYPWTIAKTINNVTKCVCGSKLNGIVHCDPVSLRISVMNSRCMTYSHIYNTTLVGFCVVNSDGFIDFPQYVDISPLSGNESVNFDCNQRYQTAIRRMGQNCGECQPGYAPAVFSYQLVCVKCTEYKYNWLIYIAMTFLPLFAVYVVIVLFRINITSGAMNSYILISQLIASPNQIRMITMSMPMHGISSILFKIGISIYTVWNLDILYIFYSPFCLHPNLSMLQLLALQYVNAIFPLVLIIITSVLVFLHNKHSWAVRLWKPFYWIFSRIRREWNIHSTLVDAFAAFILLSYVRITNTTFDLLTPVSLYNISGVAVPKRYLYYAGTVEYFGKEHLPYAVLALTMLLLFNILPLVLLFLYPCRCFHKCLNRYQIHSNTLHAFIYVFQGCYKTEPYDCRYFAGIYLGFRFVALAIFAYTTCALYYVLIGILSMFVTVSVALVKPYDNKFCVAVDVLFFAFFTLMSFLIPGFTYARSIDPGQLHSKWYSPAEFALLIPPMYGIGLMACKFLPKRVLQKLKAFGTFCTNKCCQNTGYEELEDPPPYRLEHPDEYPPLLA